MNLISFSPANMYTLERDVEDPDDWGYNDEEEEKEDED